LGAQSLDRAKADVVKWRQALDEWEDAKHPDRFEMIQLYQEIEQDDSVSTAMENICLGIEGTEFEIGKANADGFNVDQEKTDLLKTDWFELIMKHIIESEMQGFTLVEILPSELSAFSTDNVKIIPRHLVIPEQGKVRRRPTVNMDLIDYMVPAYASRLLMIGDKKEKGLFNKLALLYIYKKNALAFWANYQSKFGVPPVIVQTDLTDKLKVDSLVSFLQDMRSNSFSLVGFDDQISVLNGVNTDAYKTFDELIKRCDAQIAKVLEGQTMTTSDGSSRSQAEVHERTGEKRHLARLRKIERVVNSQLFPILTQDGAQLDGLVFRFKEVKNVDAIIDRVVKLKQAGYSVEVEYLSELTGLPLEKIEASAPIVQAASVIKAIDGLYNDALGCC
jgi:phage gp29-like protein